MPTLVADDNAVSATRWTINLAERGSYLHIAKRFRDWRTERYELTGLSSAKSIAAIGEPGCRLWVIGPIVAVIREVLIEHRAPLGRARFAAGGCWRSRRGPPDIQITNR